MTSGSDGVQHGSGSSCQRWTRLRERIPQGADPRLGLTITAVERDMEAQRLRPVSVSSLDVTRLTELGPREVPGRCTDPPARTRSGSTTGSPSRS